MKKFKRRKETNMKTKAVRETERNREKKKKKDK